MLSFLIKSAQNLGKDILAIISRCKGNKKKGNTKLFRLLIAKHNLSPPDCDHYGAP